MNLLELQTEVLARGFDPATYAARITQFINDGLALIARRVDYYVDDAAYPFQTTSGTGTYAMPANLARARSLSDTDRRIEMEYVSIRDIDKSSVTNGAPMFYTLNSSNLVLYPVPDNVYNLQLRYWSMPAVLSDDNDVPQLPSDWTHLLWVYAVWQCYEAEDDPSMGQYWMSRFNTELSMFTADQKFPDTDGPSQARGMWEGDNTLTPQGGSWSLYGGF